MFKTPHLSLLFWAILVFYPAAAQAQQPDEATLRAWFEKGIEYSENKDYEEAVYWLRKAADQGHEVAQNNLGYMYEKGYGIAKDYKKAVYWYRKAADQGYEVAQNNLGYMYEKGYGIAKDYEEAVYWYRKAADQGYAAAQTLLGYMYDQGYGVAKDYEEAVYWWRKAADQGHEDAQNNLGYMYGQGYGVAKDYEEAVYWLRKAADQGYAAAQFNLGMMYYRGQGVARDYEEAAYWLRKAADQGVATAQNNLGYMYEQGYGVAKDYKKAAYWYRKAADQGDEEAKEALARLEEESPRPTTVTTHTDPYTGMQFVKVQAGTFTMGCTSEQSDCWNDEKPAHRVTLTQDYYLGKYEVTQAQWRKVMGSNPSKFKNCDNCPVERVSWDDIQEFLVKLNAATGTKGTSKNYRLPTEAEWEYAARGGHKATSTKYAGSNDIDEVAWYNDNSGYKTHPVGQKAANELGLYDMTGNVCEWCADWYGSSYYSSSSQTDPKGPSSGQFRVLRGGSWRYYARGCRVSNRDAGTPDYSYNSRAGFRLCLSL